MNFLNECINTESDVRRFVDGLAANNKLYHYEDDPRDVLKNFTNQPLFTNAECKLLDKRIEEMCKSNLLEYAFNYTINSYL